MNPTLYFLRSSEQKIATDMLTFAYRLDEIGKTAKDIKELDMYREFYGLSTKDLGLYALVDNNIAGAAWIRLLQKDDNSNAFIDDKTPVLTIGVKPEYRDQGIGRVMLEQLFLEAGSLFEKISVSVLDEKGALGYFEKLGFYKLDNSQGKSPIDGYNVVTMVKNIAKEAVVRPTDGYDPKRWMD